jgi:hypothetical protein
METQKVYVNPGDDTSVIKCAYCGTARTRYVGNFKGKRRCVKIRCRCQKTFKVQFEFRKSKRKETNIVGYYAKLPKDETWQKMLVTNISPSGVGLLAQSTHDLRKGDLLSVRFSIKDSLQRSMVERDAVVRWANNIHLGCEFTTSVAYDAVEAIPGYYLIP